ncbi:MAG: GAF domain-containing protein [Nitrospirae bacterium]|nr:GAF domain-containing protein [Nitrospirota bacterium]
MDAGLAIVSRILRHRLRQADIIRILKSISAEGQEEFIEKIADILDKIAAFIEISHRLSDTLSLDSLLQYMIAITTDALNADRSTLFLNDRETGELFSRITQGELTREIRFPNHMGIAGAVFTTGQPIIIHDAYSDPRFNRDIDKETGYHTKNILCAPIKGRDGEITGAIQLLNKKDGDFSSDDLILLEGITSQASAALQNARLFEEVQKAKEEETQLLDVTTAISSELKLEPLLLKIMETSTDILNADRSTLFLHDEKTGELWSLIAQGTENVQIRFPSNAGIAGTVFTRGETINIPDAYADLRFNKEIDKKTGYRTHSILCMPIINKAGKIIGVTQVLNKKGGPFTPIDENRLRAFSAQASIAIENAKLFDDVLNMKNYNESMLESMSNGVITLDAQNRIVKCNAAALRILRSEPADIVSRQASEYFAEKNRWITDSVMKVLEKRRSDITLDTELFLADGQGISINLTVVPLIDVKKELIGAMLVFEDITMEKRLKGTMARYMTKEVAEKLLEGGETVLGGQIQEATVFFSDIRSFTTISEKIGPQQTVSMLNEYFTLMVDIVFRYSGILDKYIGDAILAVFGAPFSSGEDEDKAVNAAIDMMKALQEFNLRRTSEGQDPINIGVGINTAEILSGNIGSLKRMDYTVIGDGVNLASRLESANKYYGTKILISEFTFHKLKNSYLSREIDHIRVKGKNRPVAIYEILDFFDGQSFPHLDDVLGLYLEGLAFYRQRRWKEGVDKFKQALLLHDDCASKIYLDRCSYFLVNPPEDSWDGVWVMKEK